MKFLQARWSRFRWESQLLILFASVSAIPMFLNIWPDPPSVEAEMELTTHIPKGFVLVPIELENYEALDSILGRFGFVDLYRTRSGEKERTPVARNVRLIRAPRNPTHFAALVPEERSAILLSHSGSYVAIVKREGGGTEFEKSRVGRKRKIIYGGDS